MVSKVPSGITLEEVFRSARRADFFGGTGDSPVTAAFQVGALVAAMLLGGAAPRVCDRLPSLLVHFFRSYATPVRGGRRGRRPRTRGRATKTKYFREITEHTYPPNPNDAVRYRE